MTGIDKLIVELHLEPVEGGDAGELTAADHAHRLLRTAILAERDGGKPDHPRGLRPRRSSRGAQRRRGAIRSIAVSAGLAVVLAVVAVQLFARGGAARPSLAAAAVLRRAAAATLASPPRRLTAGHYWYQETLSTDLDGGTTREGSISAYVTQRQQTWVGARTGVIRRTTTRIRPSQPVRFAWQRAALKPLSRPFSATFTSTEIDAPVSYHRLLTAPTSLNGLRQFVLHAETRPGFTPAVRWTPDILVNSIHDILIEPIVPARVRAGLFKLLATIRGVRSIGDIPDSLHRPTTAVAYADRDQGAVYEFMFDAHTYALLEERQTELTPHTGRLESETAYLTLGQVVDNDR